MLDEVAATLGTGPATLVVVSPEFNSSWAVLGLRLRRVLTLGLPMLAALDSQERVALIAHELAHARNGDSGRGLFVSSALNGLPSSTPCSPGGPIVFGELLVISWLANGDRLAPLAAAHGSSTARVSPAHA